MYCCRICFEDEPQCNRHLVIAPCQCRGTSKWVHRSCLDQWRSTREDKAFASCTECKFKYSLIPTVDDSYSTRFYNRLKYSFMVFRDLTLALLFVQFIIIITSLLIYYFDSKSNILYFKKSKFVSYKFDDYKKNTKTINEKEITWYKPNNLYDNNDKWTKNECVFKDGNISLTTKNETPAKFKFKGKMYEEHNFNYTSNPENSFLPEGYDVPLCTLL